MRQLSSRILLFILVALPSFALAQPPAPRVVDLTASDGTKLKATYFAAGKSGPGVLFLHQCNRQRMVWDGLASQLSAAGINVLSFDLRNFGESAGEPFDKLSPQDVQASAAKWPSDIDTAYAYLTSQPGVKQDTIGVGGASCGVNSSVQTAIRHPEVKSLVLLSGNTDLKGRQFLRSSKLPIFFGFADDDEFPASVLTIQWLYSLTPNPGKQLAHYDKGGHGADIFKVHPELQGKITDWFVTTLIKMPGRAPVQKDQPGASKEAHIIELIDEPGGPAKVEEMLTTARKYDPKAILFPEDIVNIMGYEYMQSGDNKRALEILKLNADAYPHSANVYDSLSDAYLADGQKDLARQNAKRALELLPNDPSIKDEQRRKGIQDSAEQKLKQLGDTPR
jgi:dienelactone hydrolase